MCVCTWSVLCTFPYADLYTSQHVRRAVQARAMERCSDFAVVLFYPDSVNVICLAGDTVPNYSLYCVYLSYEHK